MAFSDNVIDNGYFGITADFGIMDFGIMDFGIVYFGITTDIGIMDFKIFEFRIFAIQCHGILQNPR